MCTVGDPTVCNRTVGGGTACGGTARAGLGNRIEARGTQRSTTHEASKGQPGTTDRTVHFVCLMGVRRTRGVETTRRRPSGKGPLISLDQPERTPLHPCHVGGTDRSAVVRIRSFRQRSSSANVRSFARALAPMSTSPGGTSQSRSIARSRRRSRLRWTADPVARPMAKATCGGTTSESGTNEHQSGSTRTRTPSRRRRMNASRSRIRSIKPTDGLGPWRDGTSARRGRPGCSYAHGNRVCALGGGCWADRYASRRSPDTSRCSNHEPYREPHGPPAQTDLPRLRPCVHLRQPRRQTTPL